MATTAPEETDILCEFCGYTLNGLPPGSNCPECGSPIDLSISERFRKPPVWEDIGDPRPNWLRFLITTSQVIFKPRRFYRTSTARGELSKAKAFANFHWIITALLVGYAAMNHWYWYWTVVLYNTRPPTWLAPILILAIPLAIWVGLALVTRLAASLTTWEASYRGYRLPHGVVLRALYYHAAHFLPVVLLATITTGGYHFLLRQDRFDPPSATVYLGVLCGEVIVCAAYLFNTYWIGMRNLMYANR